MSPDSIQQGGRGLGTRLPVNKLTVWHGSLLGCTTHYRVSWLSHRYLTPLPFHFKSSVYQCFLALPTNTMFMYHIHAWFIVFVSKFSLYAYQQVFVIQIPVWMVELVLIEWIPTPVLVLRVLLALTVQPTLMIVILIHVWMVELVLME